MLRIVTNTKKLITNDKQTNKQLTKVGASSAQCSGSTGHVMYYVALSYLVICGQKAKNILPNYPKPEA